MSDARSDDEAAAAAAERQHVWKGVTPSRLPTLHGVALVGRVICVWWAGNEAFFPALVRAFNSTHAAVGDVDGGCGGMEP